MTQTNSKKNWAKVYEFDEFDILIRKNFDSDEEQDILAMIIYNARDAIGMSYKIGFSSEAKRDKAFDDTDETRAKEIGLEIIKQAIPIAGS